MTNHELLAGFLDRSLSEDELLDFEARQAASPEFAAEVRELLTVENMLSQAAPRINYPVGFLSSVEHAVAAKVSASASTGLFATLAQSAWTWIAGGAAAVVIGGGALYFTSTSDGNSAAPQPVKTERVQPVVTPATPPAPSQPKSVAPTATTVANPPSNNVEMQPVAQREAAQVQVDGKANSPDAAILQTMAEYDKCTASNDHVRCAQIALVLGKRMREDKKFDAARTYFEDALKHARALRLREYEGKALEELKTLDQR